MNTRHFSIATCIVVILLLMGSGVFVVFHANTPVPESTSSGTEKNANLSRWLTPQTLNTLLLLIGLATILFMFPRKGDIDTLKGNIDTLKEDVEKDIDSLKNDIEKDIDSLKNHIEKDINHNHEGLTEVRQYLTNHLENHNQAPATKKSSNERIADKSLQEIVTPQEGDFPAHDHDKGTGS